MITGKNYIGNTLSSEGEITFKTFNPKTNSENKHIFTEASDSEINRAVAIASSAFSEFQNVSGQRKSGQGN